MRSLWTESCNIPGFPSLSGDAETEVLIIGGGITGVLCAYFLEQRGIRYILVERNRIGSGVILHGNRFIRKRNEWSEA